MKEKKNVLKYLVASFIPIVIYGIILFLLPDKPSYIFTIISILAIGSISQFAFQKYIEKNK